MNQKIYRELSTFASGASLLIRYPQEDKMRYYHDSHFVLLDKIEDLKFQRGFVFAPFDLASGLPILHLPENKCVELSLDKIEIDPIDLDNRQFPATDLYRREFATFNHAVASGEFHKLVLAREAKVGLNMTDDQYPQLFFSLVSLMPSACVYMLHIPTKGIWIGASPEILLHSFESGAETMALAGSVSNLNNKSPESFGSKNLHEHEVVVNYIEDVLKCLDIPYHTKPIETVPAGKVCHLRTPFSIDEPLSLEMMAKVVARLHPTPAVAGLPKENAMRFIIDNESLQRDYYAGFFGLWNVDNQTSLFVNLRCANIQYSSNDANLVGRIFAGGGIMPSSQCEEEWQETVLKQSVIRQVLKPYLNE